MTEEHTQKIKAEISQLSDRELSENLLFTLVQIRDKHEETQRAAAKAAKWTEALFIMFFMLLLLSIAGVIIIETQM